MYGEIMTTQSRPSPSPLTLTLRTITGVACWYVVLHTLDRFSALFPIV